MLFNKKKLISIVVTLFSIGINKRQLDFHICFCTQSVVVSQRSDSLWETPLFTTEGMKVKQANTILVL